MEISLKVSEELFGHFAAVSAVVYYSTRISKERKAMDMKTRFSVVAGEHCATSVHRATFCRHNSCSSRLISKELYRALFLSEKWTT